MPLNRREIIRTLAATSLTGLVAGKEARANQTAERAARGMPSPRIKDVACISTAPTGARLCVVKVITDQDGLYGYGCATFHQRSDLIAPAVEAYAKALLVGKPADRIDDTWQILHNSSYWRNGPVLNAAMSGVDQALWDIKGRQAGMPVYQLLGGKCREAAACYTHAAGAEPAQVIENAKAILARGFRYMAVQIGTPQRVWTYYGAGAGGQARSAPVQALHKSPNFEGSFVARRSLKMIEECRKQLGAEVELLHDLQETLPPIHAIQFAKDVEQYKLFFLEDTVAPEDIAYLRILRQQCATPLATGELLSNPHEWTPLIAERLIDYLRLRVSQAGGLTPCRKTAAFAEIFGVKTAWHGPGDMSPIGHAANLALDLACHNFGIQEYTEPNDLLQEVFPGTLVARDGYLYPNEKPGWCIEVNQTLAAKYPFLHTGHNGSWGDVRRMDGTVVRQ